MIDYAKIAEEKRALARGMRDLAAREERNAAEWEKHRDGRTRRRAIKCRDSAAQYLRLAETFDSTAAALEKP